MKAGLLNDTVRSRRSDAWRPNVPTVVHDALASSGRPLDLGTRRFMESRLGHEFGRVRVHTGRHSTKAADGVGARAFTVGRHLVFAEGQYGPQTVSGRDLLAHELTHSLQQGQVDVARGRDLDLGPCDGPHEKEATARCNEPRPVPRSARVALVQRACGSRDIGHPVGCVGTGGASVFDVGGSSEELFLFEVGCDDFRPGEESRLRRRASELATQSGFEIHGFASEEGNADFNVDLSCARARKAKEVLLDEGVPVTAFGGLIMHGATPGPRPEHRSVVIPATTPVPTQTPRPVVCPALPTSTPGSCTGRNLAYCISAACQPRNSWLDCACTASAEVCRAIDAFQFRGTDGQLLAACAFADGASPLPINSKGRWFESTNRCIWTHWRAAFDAIHDPSRPVSSGLTPEWVTAVSVCRTKGIGSKDCCRAHVDAEQHAIDRCGPYDSRRFGLLPTDVPGSSTCSAAARRFARSALPPFRGDFGNTAHRIAYGNRVCCR